MASPLFSDSTAAHRLASRVSSPAGAVWTNNGWWRTAHGILPNDSSNRALKTYRSLKALSHCPPRLGEVRSVGSLASGQPIRVLGETSSR
ncbi:MAG: hypothetical protein NT031_00990, partial [Planctomycetota bacterium]|nr:hypothetical protein [Planctomycetota bacterium]